MIEVEGLRKEYRTRSGGVTALAGIDLFVPPGTIHGVVGRSGAGKSTLVRCLTLLERPTAGTVRIDGRDLTALRASELRQARRRIGMVFQHVNLLDNRTAAANVAHPLELAGSRRTARRDRVRELLDLVGLAGRGGAYPSQLSGGQRQRVGIARALAAEPAVLLCDEPTSALDAATTRQILGLIRDVRSRLGVTVLLITHEPAVVKDVCDSVSFLENGRIVEEGALADVLSDEQSRLADDLLPLFAPDELDRLVLVDVFFAGANGGDRVFAGLVRHLAADVPVVGGTIETHGKAQFGRLRLGLEPDSLADALAFLRARGLAVRIVTGR